MTMAKLPLLRWVLTAVAICATGMLGMALPQFGASMTLPILPSGIAVAAYYRWGRRMWPAIAVGTLAIDLGRAPGPLMAICVAIGLLAGCEVFQRILDRQDFEPRFTRARDVPVYVAAACCGMAFAATFGLLGHFLGREDRPFLNDSMALSWLSWWSNTTAGVLLLGSVLIGLSARGLVRVRADAAAAGAWLLAVAGCIAVVFLAHDMVFRAPILVVAMIVVVVGAIRFGLVPGGLAALAISTAVAFSVAFNRGVLAGLPSLEGHVMLWSSASALCGVNLIVTALLAERDAAGRDKARAEQRYATIFNASPQPLWVHDPRTRQFLLVNDAAVSQYGYRREELLASTIEMLAVPGGGGVLPPAEDEPGSHPYETRHRARDGRVLEVEVSTSPIDFAGNAAVLVFSADVTERRALGRALIDAIGNEQRRIGQEMHDGLGQELTGLALTAKAIATNARREQLSVSGGLDALADLANVCIQSARDIVRGLSPLSGAGDSLEEALDALARRSSRGGTTVTLRARLDAQLDADLETRVHLYRIAQEALQNALKHARATEVGIELWVQRTSIRLSITDNGSGLGEGAVSAGGLGMRTMRFRTSAIGGRLRIAATAGGGTSVVCEVPLRPRLAAAG